MIKIEELSFYYKKRKPLFEGFSLEVEDGQIVGLLGKNGAGKSTLLKLIAGILAPQQGKLNVNGHEPFQRIPDFLKDIYMIPEEFYLPSTTIDNYTKALMPLYPAFDRKKLHNILNEFELEPGDNLNNLSHGQRKKFLIAFALAANCQLLILDEPTNGLDIPSKSLFRKVLVNSVNDEQLVLISTHQVKDIDTVIDKVVVIDDGAIAYQDNLENISRKYLFETSLSIDNQKDIIYQEKSPMGYRTIRPATENNETLVDLELLFNAVTGKAIR